MARLQVSKMSQLSDPNELAPILHILQVRLALIQLVLFGDKNFSQSEVGGNDLCNVKDMAL